jgi:hypothetical protein
MNANPKSVTVVITCAIRPDKMELARRELEAVIEKVIANEPACHGSMCTMTRRTHNVC